MKNLRITFAISCLSICSLASAQITTSEITVEQTNNVTSVIGSVEIGIDTPSGILHLNSNSPSLYLTGTSDDAVLYRGV